MEGVQERFWDMFVVDALIGNNDRNNMNWGLLLNKENNEFSIEPVFDNGNAFYSKRSVDQIEKRLWKKEFLIEDAYKTSVCAFKYIGQDNELHHINPYTYIKQTKNNDCNNAVLRLVERFEYSKIESIIDNIPVNHNGISVMPEMQKMFYKDIIQLRYNDIILPAALKISKKK